MDRILLAHGGGGSLSNELISDIIIPALGAEWSGYEDSSPIPESGDLRFTTDAFVVKPLFFPGGDIGSLSVHGTLNDLAVSGAEPLALSLSLIIEEGLEIDLLGRVMKAAGRAAADSGVSIVTGDTKVVSRGEADGLFIVTSGVGRSRANILPSGAREGDMLIINGPIADHGVAVMSEREGIHFNTPVRSDSAPVWPHVKVMLDAGVEIHAMRDPTRGGLAASCVELADSSGVSIQLEENSIPVRSETAAACAMLGLDHLTVANEGKVVFFVPRTDAERAVGLLKIMPGAENAAIIGNTVSRREKAVYLRTRHGGERIVEMPYGEELPRIC